MNDSRYNLSDLGQLIGIFGGQPTPLMQEFLRDARLANLSPATIDKRVELIERFRRFLGADRELITASTDDLRSFQRTFAHRAPATVDIYTRHLKAFFAWTTGRGFTGTNAAAALILPNLPKGRPHPTHIDDLQVIFATTRGSIRLAFVLAAFAGLRRGEICAMQRRDLDMSGALATALIHGKGRKERVVPLLGPVVDELRLYGVPRAGHVLLRNGMPYVPDILSLDVHRAMKDLGIETTLHSARHAFATRAARVTRDPLFVRDLLGHESVGTTEIYMQTSLNDAHLRLAQMSTLAGELLGNIAADVSESPPARSGQGQHRM